jgi:hypothetical protein
MGNESPVWAQRIRALREARGLSQSDAAEEMRTHSKKILPAADHLLRILENSLACPGKPTAFLIGDGGTLPTITHKRTMRIIGPRRPARTPPACDRSVASSTGTATPDIRTPFRSGVACPGRASPFSVLPGVVPGRWRRVGCQQKAGRDRAGSARRQRRPGGGGQ